MFILETAADMGKAIRDIRLIVGMSRRKLARLVAEQTGRGVDAVNSQIWTWETGKRSPNPETAAPVLAALGYRLMIVPIDDSLPQEEA